MRVLILGGNGMVGHYLYRNLKKSFDLKVTFKKGWKRYNGFNLFDKNDCFFNVNALNPIKFEEIIALFKPDFVINCIGVTKQLINKKNINFTYAINSHFPNVLATMCAKYKSKLILLSTDCVFSGKKGNYSELDYRDADDVYGQSKIQGEILRENVLIIRKSTIGLELSNFHGLIEWFLSQKGNIKGFRGAIYSGLITAELSRVIKQVITDYRQIEGIYNVSSAPVSKYYLLKSLSNRLNLNNISIEPDDTFACDRSLNMEKLSLFTGYKAPSWDSMLDELAEEILKKY